MDDKTHNQYNLEDIQAYLADGKTSTAAEYLNALHPAEIAHILESLPQV